MKKNPILIGFLQAATLATYISLVVLLISSIAEPDEPDKFLGTMLAITVFATSALISGVITLGYPVYLIWKQKEFKLAIKSVIATAIWLSLFILALIITVLASL